MPLTCCPGWQNIVKQKINVIQRWDNYSIEIWKGLVRSLSSRWTCFHLLVLKTWIQCLEPSCCVVCTVVSLKLDWKGDGNFQPVRTNVQVNLKKKQVPNQHHIDNEVLRNIELKHKCVWLGVKMKLHVSPLRGLGGRRRRISRNHCWGLCSLFINTSPYRTGLPRCEFPLCYPTEPKCCNKHPWKQSRFAELNIFKTWKQIHQPHMVISFTLVLCWIKIKIFHNEQSCFWV